MKKNTKKRLLVGCSCCIATGLITAWYVHSHPLVFNESFWEHAHCIGQATTPLAIYASEHGGRFPAHTNGYGDALLLLEPGVDAALNGPGYDTRAFERARQTGAHLPERDCGRVYVPGLSETNDQAIAILFDKMPTPGGDHCHGLARFVQPLSREILTIGGWHETVRESDWRTFARHQIELLVVAGITRGQAERFYAEAPAR